MNKKFNKKGPAKNISFQSGLYVCPPCTLMLVKEITNTFTLPCPVPYQNCQITPKLSNFRVQLLISYLPFVNSTIAQQSWCNKVCPTWYHFYLYTYHHYNRIEGMFANGRHLDHFTLESST